MPRRLPLIVTLLLAVLGISACDSSAYHRSGGQWQHGDVAFTPEDPNTFAPIDALFAKDALRGYYRGAVVADSDGASFVVVSEHEARDRHRVYYCDTFRKGQEYWSIKHLRIVRIDGADPASYVSIGKDYARDKRRVYAEGVPFDVRDPATYEPLDGNFGRDAQRGYYARAEIAGSDGPSFSIIDERDSSYARDRTNVYYGHRDIDGQRAPNTKPREIVQVLHGADPAAMRVLGRDYAADTRHVWHRGQPVDGADAATFAVDTTFQGSADATDQSGPWQQGKRMVPSR